MSLLSLAIKIPALADVAQWIGCQFENQKVAGSIPSQGTRLVCRPGPQLGVCKRKPITNGCFSPSLSPSFPLSLKINKLNSKKKKKSHMCFSVLSFPDVVPVPDSAATTWQRLCQLRSLSDYWVGKCVFTVVHMEKDRQL